MQLITDRTDGDVLLGTEKGRYNYTDLNRVENAVAQLLQFGEPLGLKQNLIIKTDWGLPGSFNADEWPTAAQMQRYLSNVRTLRDAVSLESALPETMEHLTWQGANAIEQVLSDVHLRMNAILNTLQYSGEIFAGEELYL